MAPPDKILRLIDNFDTHKDHYTSSAYNETQLRREFLDPFFKELGWDIDNKHNYAHAYKDVIHEDAIKIGGNTKAPDYSFRIGGQRKFFLEAKKPSINIKDDINPAFQLRRYAWSAKLPLSILSDFEEFAVYDCRIRPVKTDKASKSRVLYYTYDQYAAKWDEISEIFSHEAILKGSFDKYAESTTKKRGTAEVDDAFLDEINRWRELLARNFALKNPVLSIRDINYAVQKTIDRIIFLRICEDRGTEDYKRLEKLQKEKDTYSHLLKLFSEADDRYNSGLFHFNHESERPGAPDTLTPKLLLDDKTIKDILKNLYYPDSPYEFSVLSADILGQVYEQFLGKTISLTSSHKVEIDEKPEVRKAGGVYYTPTYVVDYIIENTLGKFLNGPDKNNPTPIAISQAENIKILDPACGSGSFLIAAYQYLLDWHRDQYTLDTDNPNELRAGKIKRHAGGQNPKIYQGPGGDYRLTTAERKRILLNNIYGVDIDRQAVEVTKLSLLLKVLEGETQQVLQRDFIAERERILPDLGNNIKCGNSLIGSEFYDQPDFLELDDETQYRINAFDWEKEFHEIFQNGGFDCVIGNPPYGATLDESQKQFFSESYVCQSYQLDSYLLFLERALKLLLNSDSLLGFIIPNPWLTNIKQQATRSFITKSARIDSVVHFTNAVFSSAVVDTQVLIAGLPNKNDHYINIFTSDGPNSERKVNLTAKNVQPQRYWEEQAASTINIFLTEEDIALSNRLTKSYTQLESLVNLSVGIKPYQKGKGNPKQTKNDVENRPFDSSSKLDSSYMQIIRGKDIQTYLIKPLDVNYIKYGPWLAEPRPKAKFDSEIKIVMRQTGDSLVAALDTNKFLCMNNLHVLTPLSDTSESLYYFIGIINSSLLDWYYWYLNPERGEALAEIKRTNIARLPIRTIDFDDSNDVKNYNEIIKLVNTMLDLKVKISEENNPDTLRHLKSRIDTTEHQIDSLVYDLYSLTEDEISLVEQI